MLAMSDIEAMERVIAAELDFEPCRVWLRSEALARLRGASC